MEPISDISKKLSALAKGSDEFINSTQLHNPIILNTFKEVGETWRKNSINETHKLMIDSVVDYVHEQLHIGHWSSVPLSTKKAFTASSFLKVNDDLFLLRDNVNIFYRQLCCYNLIHLRRHYMMLSNV